MICGYPRLGNNLEGAISRKHTYFLHMYIHVIWLLKEFINHLFRCSLHSCRRFQTLKMETHDKWVRRGKNNSCSDSLDFRWNPYITMTDDYMYTKYIHTYIILYIYMYIHTFVYRMLKVIYILYILYFSSRSKGNWIQT